MVLEESLKMIGNDRGEYVDVWVKFLELNSIMVMSD